MIAVSTTTETQAEYRGIKVRTESGKPAKIYTDDEPILVVTESGTGEGVVENVGEYEEDGRVGTILDYILKNRTAGASVVNLSADADGDAGEVRRITLPANITTTEPEAAAFDVPAPLITPIV